jgi:hypothetical protein
MFSICGNHEMRTVAGNKYTRINGGRFYKCCIQALFGHNSRVTGYLPQLLNKAFDKY